MGKALCVVIGNGASLFRLPIRSVINRIPGVVMATFSLFCNIWEQYKFCCLVLTLPEVVLNDLWLHSSVQPVLHLSLLE